MKTLIINFVIFYLNLASNFYIVTARGYPCVRSCPVVEVKKEDHLSGTWECGACGKLKSRASATNYECDADFNTFKVTRDSCTVKTTFCDTQECDKGNTTRCQDVYLSNYCCICEEGMYGQFCMFPRMMYIESTVHRGKGTMMDWKNRPECWAVIVHHTRKWTSQAMISFVMVAWMERVNKLPFNVFFKDEILNYIFTKYTLKISKSESEHWCLTSTDLREYCLRFNMIFDPKFNTVATNVRHIVYLEKDFPFEADYAVNPRVFVSKREGVPIGYSFSTDFTVLPFTLEAPYYRYLVFTKRKIDISTSRVYLFSNQTGVDSTCIPNFNQLCQTTLKKYKAFPFWTLTFKMEFHPPPPECEETSIAQWRVFKKSADITYKVGEEILYREGCCSVTFPPYTFTTGTYFFKFTMMHIQGGKKIYNSKMCLKPIYNDKIAASFDQEVKLVNTEEVNEVHIEAYDINNRPGDQKKNLIYVWSCTLNGNTEPCSDIKNLLGKTATIEIPKFKLKVNCTYNFSVVVLSSAHVYGIEDNTDGFAYQVLRVTTGERNFISLVCLTCDQSRVANPEQYNLITIRAEDRVSPPTPADYDWWYAEISPGGSQGQYRPVDDIRVNGTSHIVLKINKDVLGYNKLYAIKAVRRNTKIFAEITIKTPQLNINFTCTLDPLEGVQGWTDFNVDCPIEGEALFFEFYDKEEDDELIFNGRMVGYDDEGVIRNFKMTKNKFFVVAFDHNSLVKTFSFNIKLRPYNDTVKYLQGLISRTKTFLEVEQFEWPSATVSSVATVTSREMKPPAEVLESPISVLHRTRLDKTARPMKMLLASLKTVLINIAAKFDILEKDAYLTESAAETLSTVSQQMLQYAMSNSNDPTFTRIVFYQVVKAVFDCAEILLQQRNWEYVNKTEDYTRPFIADLVQETSFVVVTVLDTISYTLVKQQIIGDRVRQVVSDGLKLHSYTKVDFFGYVIDWITETGNCSVVISNETIYFSSIPSKWKNDVLKLQYIRLFVNPFWWAGQYVVSEILLIKVCKETKNIDCHLVTRFNDFIALNLEVIEPLDHIVPLEGTAHQVNPKISQDQKELDLTVYRLFLPKRARLYLKFLLNGTEEFRVMLVDGLRPEYDTMIKHSTVINATSSEYLVPYKNWHDLEKVYYLGILPAEGVPVGERVPFRLRIYYTLCTNWMRWRWGSYGCWVGDTTSEANIHCDCKRLLSMVAGIMTVPEHNLSHVSEFLLYLTSWVNFVPLVVMSVILLLYVVLLVFAVIEDKKDLRSGEVIVLWDNFPGEPFAYLVGVHTGSRINSGTAAKVGMMICGLSDESRPHILTSSDRKVLRAFSEDWFLIYTPRYLGKLRSIWLWHNDEGFSSDWFVETVEVFDLKEKVQYIFEIRSWIALEIDKYPELLAGPMKMDEYFSAANVFRNNFQKGMRDTHNWTSIFLKHSRNPVTRVERCIILLVFIFSAMAICLLLYLFYFGIFIDEDKPSYQLYCEDLLIFVVSWIAASIITAIVEGLFRKSMTHEYKFSPQTIRTSRFSNEIEYPKSVPSLNYPDRFLQDGKVLKINADIKFGRQKTTCDRLKLALYKIVRGSSFLPVRLPNTKSDLIVRKSWFVIAWLVSLVTVLITVSVVALCVWKLPTVKNERFLTVFLAILFFDAFILSPFTILALSALLSITFRDILPETTYHMKIKDGKRWNLYGNETFLKNLVERRKQKIYYPLKEWEKESKRQKKIRTYRLGILFEFIMVVIILCVVWVIFKIAYVNKYTSNTHAKRMMSRSEDALVPDLSRVFNRTQLYLFLDKAYVRRLHRFMWYNYDPLFDPRVTKKEWTSDCVTKLLGNTRIRQVRVMSQRCPGGKFFNDSIEPCAPPWHRGVEEKDVFSPGWLRGGYEDTVRKKSFWRYTDASISNSSRVFGESGTMYGAGGYITDTSHSKTEARYKLYALNIYNWLDHRTRAVFIELTLYNVNVRLFTQVVLVCEQHPSGLYVSSPEVDSVNINLTFNFWNIGFVVFQIFFFFRAIYFMNRYGIFTYFSSFINCYEILLLVLGFSAVILYIGNLINSSIYVEDYRRSGLYEFFNFFELIRFDFMSNAALVTLFLCMVGKLLMSWKFGKIYYTFYYTLQLSWSWIVWLTSYFTLCVIVPWRLVTYRMNIYTFSHFSAAVTVSQDYKAMVVHKVWQECVLVYLVCITSSVIVLLFIASFIHFYRVAKFYKPFNYKEIDHFNFVKFFKIDFKRLLRKMKNKKLKD